MQGVGIMERMELQELMEEAGLVVIVIVLKILIFFQEAQVVEAVQMLGEIMEEMVAKVAMPKEMPAPMQGVLELKVAAPVGQAALEEDITLLGVKHNHGTGTTVQVAVIMAIMVLVGDLIPIPL